MSDLAAELRDRAVLVVAGQDAPAFLQNMTTCDVRLVTPERGVPGALCTAKGRVTAYFHLVRRGPGYALVLPRASAEAAAQQLGRMVFRSKVTVVDATPEVAAWGVSGTAAVAALEARVGSPLAAPGAAVDAQDLTALRLPGDRPRAEVLAPRGAGWPEETAGGAAAAWDLEDVLAGEPAIYPETAEAFLPQFLDLDRRGGLSFRKGCFPGQEIVARTQHLGEVKRRLALAHVAAEPPAPGTPLRALREDGDRDGGTVVRAAADPGGGALVLAVVPVAEREAGRPIHLGVAGGPALSFRELPARDW